MLYLIPAWIVSCIVTFWLGYFLRGLAKKVAELGQELTMKADKKPEPEEPVSSLIDPLDEVQTMLYEHQQMEKRLNGE